MRLTKKELTKELLDIINDIGEKKNDGYVYYRKEKLLLKWEALGKGKFTEHGCGKLSAFLEKELSEEKLDSDKYRIPDSFLHDLDFSVEGCIETPLVGVSKKPKTSPRKIAKPKLSHGGDHDNPSLKLNQLKSQVLELVNSKCGMHEGGHECKLELEKLNLEWQKTNPGMKFKDYKYGSFKSFLIDKCRLKESEKKRDCFVIDPAFIKAELQRIKNESEKLASSSDDETIPSMENPSPNKTEAVTPKHIDHTKQSSQPLSIDRNSTPFVVASSADRIHCNELSAGSSKKLTHKLPETRISQSRRYYFQMMAGVFDCGLKAMRELFMRIHPNWSNTPSEIRTFDMGTMQLKAINEIAMFQSGDIDQWDISLLSKVLLYSKVSKEKLSNDKAFDGCKEAVVSITTIRSYVLAHSGSGEMTKHDYDNKMRKLRDAVVNGLGFDEGHFKKTIDDADLRKDSEFFSFYQKGLLLEFSEVKEMLKKIGSGKWPQREIYQQAESRMPNWYEWEDLRKALDRLDTDKNQYILIVDKLSEPEDENLRILANVDWKLVIDLDPDSDNGGLLTQFKSVGSIISTLLPSQLKGVTPENLLRPNVTQWLHANGRSIELTEDQKANATDISKSNIDEPKDTTDNWEKSFRIPCHEVIRNMCEKFDRMKPTFCLILGIRGGFSSEITNLILKDIRGIFDFKNHEMNFISIASEIDSKSFPNSTYSSLLTFQFLIGLAGLTGKSLETEYFLPSGVKGCPVPLDSNQYNAFSEYMEILYDGCEDIPEGSDEAELDSLGKLHLKSFISGGEITFQSLHFHHDARRDLTNEIYDDILSTSKEAQKAYIIQIKHTPGSGGTTLARRVIWDLHKKRPCVIIKMNHALENFGQDSYGETYVESLCKRISKLQEICQVAPIILMDGNSAQVITLSSCVARKLWKTPMVILRCVKYNPSAGNQKSKINSNVDRVHREFEVDYNLVSTSSEYSELKRTFDNYCTQFPEDTKIDKKKRLRVFHFPMLALLGNFIKLQNIVSDSLDLLKKNEQKEYEIAIVVAFLQIYGGVTTPASLISNYILKCNNTHEQLANQFSDTLMNLMVPGKPQRRKQYIANKYFKGSDDDEEEAQHQCVIEHYTFQHHQVADAILKYSKRSFHEITKDFLDYRILECYRCNKEITYIIDQLFLYHEVKNETHFSKLISTLADLPRSEIGKNADETQLDVGITFEDAAKQTKDATFYSHVARFFSYHQNFTKARELIKEGFIMEENVPADRKRRILDTFGHIVLNEMKTKEIEDIHHLQRDAEEALNIFKQAKDIPPRNFPNPLIGIVKVWQFCFEHLINKLGYDVRKVIELTVKDEFFSNSIAECMDLLNEVDDMVKDLVLLPDAFRTKRHADWQRYILMETFGKTKSKTKRQGLEEVNFHRICESYKATAPQKYVIRLQAMWIISDVKRDFFGLPETQKKQLYSWLEKLVSDYDMVTLARDLLCVAAVQEQPPFQIDRALKIIEKWQDKYPNDYFSYFYQYMLCFMKISEGEISEYKAKYESGIADCDRWTKDNMRRHQKQFFIGKDGKEICKLVSNSHLRSLYTGKTHNEENKEEVLDHKFWKENCRTYLLECKGRIHLSRSDGGRNLHPYINLEPGNIRISVHPKEVGCLGIDYRKDTKVSFVVAFTLAGPNAKAVEIIDGSSKKSGQEVRFGRQGNRMTHKKK